MSSKTPATTAATTAGSSSSSSSSSQPSAHAQTLQRAGRKFFLSHKWGNQHQNHRKVLQIYEQLLALGLKSENVWIDQQELSGGDSLVTEITNAVVNSDIFILFITRDYMEAYNADKRSDLCWFELNTAIMKNIKILPVLMDEGMKDVRTWSGKFEIFFRDTLHLDFSPAEIYSNSSALQQRCESLLTCAVRMLENGGTVIIEQNGTFKYCPKCKTNRICEMFDRTERSAICTPCAMSELRKDHPKVTIEEEVERLRKENHEPTISELKSSLEDLEKFKKAFQDNIQTMKTQRTLTEAEITTTFDFFRKILDKKEEELKKSCLPTIQEIDSFYEKEFLVIQEKSTELSKLMENLEICFLAYPGQQIYYTSVMVESAERLLKLKDSLKELTSKKDLKKKEAIDWDAIGEDLKKFFRADGYMELFETGFTCQWQFRNPTTPTTSSNANNNNNNNNATPNAKSNQNNVTVPAGKSNTPVTTTTANTSAPPTPAPTDIFQNKRFLTIPRKVTLLRTLISALSSGVERIRSLKIQEKPSWSMENCESLIPDPSKPSVSIGYQVSIDGLPNNKTKKEAPANLTVHLVPSVLSDISRLNKLSQYFHQDNQLRILLDRESKVSRFSFPLLCGGIQTSPLIYLWIQSAKGGDLFYDLVQEGASLQKHQFGCTEFMFSFDIETIAVNSSANRSNNDKKLTTDMSNPGKTNTDSKLPANSPNPAKPEEKKVSTVGQVQVAPGTNPKTATAKPPATVATAPSSVSNALPAPAAGKSAAPTTGKVATIPHPPSAATSSVPAQPVAAPPDPPAKKTPVTPASAAVPTPATKVPSAASPNKLAAPVATAPVNSPKPLVKLPRGSWNRFVISVQQETDADGNTGWKLCLSVNEQIKLLKTDIKPTTSSKYSFSLTAQQKDVPVKINKLFVARNSSAFLKNRNLFQARTFEAALEKEKKELSLALYSVDFLEDFNKLF